MDIDLLSKMVKDVILDRDEVSLPGVGTFVAEMVPASFSDRGYTINPPYRRLYFRQRTDAADTALADLYAGSNGLDREQAQQILTDFLSEMKEVLKARKIIVFPGLGRLRATKENNFFFVADGDLDIWPAGYGLEPISLKTHQETPEEVSSVVENLRSIIADPVSPVPTTVPEETAVPVEPDAKEESENTEIEPAVEEKSVTNEEETTVPETEERAETQDDGEAVQTGPTTETVPETIVPSETEPAVEPVEGTIPSELEGTEEETAPAVTEQNPVPEETAGDSGKPKSARKIALYICIGLLVAAVVALAAFLILAHSVPDFIDRLLYSPEELDLLRDLR